MNLKKMKRLLSVVLSATMILSSNMTGLAAEIAADPTAPAEESQIQEPTEHEHQWQLVEDLKGIERYACMVEGCTETKNEVAPIADDSEQTNPDENNTSADEVIGDNTPSDTPAEITDTSCVNHVIEAVGREDSTCFEEGHLAYYTCSACNKIYRTRSDAAAERNPVELSTLAIAKKDHKPTRIPEAPANCTTAGHSEYYECVNCERQYADPTALMNDTDGTSTDGHNKEDDYFAEEALGHSYVDAEGSSACQFEWNDFSVDKFAAKEYNVTASRTCVRENCPTENGYTQTAKSVTVEITDLAEDFDCSAVAPNTTDPNVTFTATAVFEDENGQPTETCASMQETATQKVLVKDHINIYDFTWPETGQLLSCDTTGQLKIDNDTNPVTVKYVCAICGSGKDVAPTDATVTLTETGMTMPVLLRCDEDREVEFTASASFGTDPDTTTETETKVLALPKGFHDLQWIEGTSATCTTTGTLGHYECSFCEKMFLDDDTELNLEDVEVAARGHLLGKPVFSLTNDLAPVVKATFSCTRSDCDVKYTKTASADFTDPTVPSGVTCGQEANVTYPASVEFDMDMFVPGENGEYYEDVDNENYSPADYPGTLTRTEVLKHQFTPTYTWKTLVDSSSVEHDPEAGITVTLDCSVCNKAVVLDSSREGTNHVVSDGIAGDTPVAVGTVTIGELNTENENYLAADCQNGGKDFYPVTVNVDTNDGTANTKYNKEADVENKTDPKGHRYVIFDMAEPDYSAAAPTVASLKVKCAVCTDDTSIENSFTTQEFASGINIASSTDEALGYVAASCTQGGTDIWTVSVNVTECLETVAVDQMEEVDEDGNTVLKKVVLEKATAALGHDYSGDPEWDWSDYGTVTPGEGGNKGSIVVTNPDGKVYAVYKCQNATCDGVEAEDETDTDDIQYGVETEAGSDGTETSVRVKKILATVTAEEIADCTNASDGRTHTASISGGNSQPAIINEVVEALGDHVWGEYVWGEWTKTEETTNVTVGTGDDEKTISVPVYTINASRQCTICSGGKEAFTGEANSDGYKVKVTLGTTDPYTCTSPGSTLYWAKLVKVGSDGTETDVEECALPGIHVYPATGHNYEVEWSWKVQVKGENGEPVEKLESAVTDGEEILKYTGATATKICVNCKKEIDVDTTYGTGGVNFIDNNGKIQCTATDVFSYTAQTKFTDDADDIYSDTKRVIHLKKDRHDYEWTLENWDPDTKTVKVTATCKDNEEHTFTQENVPLTVTSEDSADATCVSGAKELVTGTFSVTDPTDNNKEYKAIGTYSKADNNIDKDAHNFAPAVIDWSKPLEGGTVDKEAGTVTYTVTAKAACTLDNTTDKSHTKNVTVTAVAELTDVEKICCVDNYEITYNLSMSEADAAIYTLADGDKKVYEHTAEASHGKMIRVAAVEGNCVEAGHSAYYECQKCHKKYSDVSGNNEYTDDVEAPLGHRYGNPTYFWNVDGEKVSARFTCNRAGCQESFEGHTRTFVAEVDKTDDGDPVNYTEIEATCVDAPEAERHEGLDYYMVTATLPHGLGAPEFTNTVYHGDVPVTVPIGDHVAGDKDPTKCKFCGKTLADQVKVIFKNAAGADFATERFAVGTAADDIAAKVPEGPNRSGYTFEGWSLVENSTAEATNIAADIAAKIATNNTGKPLADVIVYPVYAEKVAKGKIIAEYVKETKTGETITLTPIEGQANTEKEGNVGSRVDITAEEVTDLVFSYWAEVNADGAIVVLSTNAVYSTFITSETAKNIKAVFVANEEDKKDAAPTVAMTDKYATGTAEATGVHKISFVATVDVPETCTVVESGILYSTNDAAGSDPTAMIVGSSNTKVKKYVFANENRTNILTIDVGANSTYWSRNIYARGYVVYTEPGSPDQKVAYSIIDCDSYNNLLSK